MSLDFRRRLRARERAALESFYATWFDRIYGYVRRMLGNDAEAEDVTQEVFLQVQRALDGYDPERALAPWVFTIATNKLRDHWRAEGRAARFTSVDADEESWPEPAAADPGPLPALEQAELALALAQAVEGLPESLRAPLILRAYGGLSFEDIGRQLERNETAVRKRYSRALAELRGVLERRWAAGLRGGAR